MKQVFADTLYWLARIAPGDTWREPALRAKNALGEVQIVTTDEVLIEVLTAVAGSGAFVREKTVQTVNAIMNAPNTMVLPQTHFTFLRGLELYTQRLDKGYSLTDCISMNVCREWGITEVLTNDHHFEQEGFQALIQKRA